MSTTDPDLKVVYRHLAEHGPEEWPRLTNFEKHALAVAARVMIAMRETVKSPGTLLMNFAKDGRLSNWNMRGDFKL